MKFNTQVCTTHEQSERLLALGLKRETADCHYWYSEGEWYVYIGEPNEYNCIPSWSLHRLMTLMPHTLSIIDENGEEWGSVLRIDRHSVQYDSFPIDVTVFDEHANLYDNLIDCIEWLIGEKHFNTLYLNKKL